MAGFGKRWITQDRDGNPIYLTQERWNHIVEQHPEMADYEEHLKTTLWRARRRQEPLNPRKYRYALPFDDLPEDYDHIVAIALFGFDVDDQGRTAPNHFVATAFMKHSQPKR